MNSTVVPVLTLDKFEYAIVCFLICLDNKAIYLETVFLWRRVLNIIMGIVEKHELSSVMSVANFE